jgi:hypothetical protein
MFPKRLADWAVERPASMHQASLVKGVRTVTIPKPAASVTKEVEVNVAA